jgi:chromosome segregation ATPase
MKNRTYTTTILSATMLISGFTLASAQEAAPATGQKIEALSAEELAERKASIPLIEERIKDREQQIEVIVKDIDRLSDRIEGRIDKIVSTLAKMKDSQNSKTRVAQMKQNAMKGLYKTIEDYNRRKAELEEQLRTGKAAVGKEAADSGVDMFNQKIEKRAEQMIALSNSFTEHADYKKYQTSSSYRYGRRGGWGSNYTHKSEKWKQNRRETVFTDGQRKKMIEALKTSIDDLERRNNTLSNKAKEGGVSEETQKFYQEDIARNDKTLETRRKQLGDLIQPGGSTPTTSVDRNQAHDTELLIREVITDIQRDNHRNTTNYNNLKQRLTSLNRIKLNLEARKAWLNKYEAAHGKAAE